MLAGVCLGMADDVQELRWPGFALAWQMVSKSYAGRTGAASVATRTGLKRMVELGPVMIPSARDPHFAPHPSVSVSPCFFCLRLVTYVTDLTCLLFLFFYRLSQRHAQTRRVIIK